MTRSRLLSICFVVYGLGMATAIFFVFIPNEGMLWIGRRMDLPPFQVTPVFEYMARGMSFLCFLFGILIVYLGLHLQEYARLVRCIGWLMLVCLPLVIVLHLRLPTPLVWKAGDTLGVLLLCVLCFLTPQQAKP